MIPRIFHFIFGLKEQTEPFHLQHYLCLESCRQVNQPDAIYFHYANEPYGPLWDKIKPHLTLRPVQRETLPHAAYERSAQGRLIAKAGWSYAHEADFIRLKVLLEHGGVYADMDTLFVQPLPDHLYHYECVLGEEGALHDKRGILRPSLCNALIAAKPGAAFIGKWLDSAYEAFDGTWTSHSCQLATRLWEAHPDLVHVVPRRYFYRHSWTKTGIQSIFEHYDSDLHDVYSMHLWNHLWWDKERTDFTHFHGGALTEDYVRNSVSTYAVLARRFLPKQDAKPTSLAGYLSQSKHQIPFQLIADRSVIQKGVLDSANFTHQPLVSCLMVTRGRLFPGKFAVDCFQRQTYSNRELVVVCDAPGTEIELHCQSLNDARIRFVYPQSKSSLGELRNLSLDAAQGDWVCQWDDDDLSHPRRIEFGMAICQSMFAHALFLSRWLLWSPKQEKLAISERRIWEGSMLAKKASVPSYPALARGEDTPVVEGIFGAGRITLIDAPWLYTYIQTGANTWDASHFEAFWKAASKVEEGADYQAALAACESFGPYRAYAQAITD